MELNSTLQKSKILIVLLFFAFLFTVDLNAQTRIYASTITSQDHVDASTPAANAIDQDLITKARLNAGAGLILGALSYSGHIELKFTAVVPANTTTFVKIATQDNLLPFLLGGDLGGLLADVGGAVLIGNQEFNVQARNNASIITQGDSFDATDFDTNNLRLVTNPQGDFFIAITPTAAYDRIRITNRVGSLVGLGNTRWLDVFEAYYVTDPANCGTAAYTSYGSSGITLDLLDLGSAGVENPQNAIDANTTNFSTLSQGILGVAATVEQTVYFEGLSDDADQFSIRIKLAQTLVDLNIANSITISTSNGGTEVTSQSLNSLLTLNLLSLQGGQIITIPISPGAPVDRLTISFTSLVSLSALQNLDFYGVVRTSGKPVITDPDTINAQVCEGQAATLLADTPAGNELRWYDAATGGNLLATVASGAAYTTLALTVNTTYYVASARINCPEESSRVAITVTVNIVPTPTTGDDIQEFCAYTSPTLANLQVNETGIVFYADATGGTPLAATTLLTNGTTYHVAIADGSTGCESRVRLEITANLADLCQTAVTAKVMLQGALFGAADGFMRDDLRVKGLIPLTQPYSSSLNERFTHVNGGGTETTTQIVLDANAGTGDAIVDWVFLEFRDATNNQTVIRTVAALLQRDGDIVAADGGALTVDLPGTFFISIKHRNHFGALANSMVTVVNAAAALDFTTLGNDGLFANPGFSGQVAMITVGLKKALFSGNASLDDRIKYDGASNDRQILASQVLTHPNNTGQILNYANTKGYYSGDINMDGVVLYDGANNDRQFILNTVLTYPLNQNMLSNYNGLLEQMP